jgi:hypothetical protein
MGPPPPRENLVARHTNSVVAVPANPSASVASSPAQPAGDVAPSNANGAQPSPAQPVDDNNHDIDDDSLFVRQDAAAVNAAFAANPAAQPSTRAQPRARARAQAQAQAPVQAPTPFVSTTDATGPGADPSPPMPDVPGANPLASTGMQPGRPRIPLPSRRRTGYIRPARTTPYPTIARRAVYSAGDRTSSLPAIPTPPGQPAVLAPSSVRRRLMVFRRLADSQDAHSSETAS